MLLRVGHFVAQIHALGGRGEALRVRLALLRTVAVFQVLDHLLSGFDGAHARRLRLKFNELINTKPSMVPPKTYRGRKIHKVVELLKQLDHVAEVVALEVRPYHLLVLRIVHY